MTTVVEQFAYTGAAQTTTVPSGCTSVAVWLWGGAGGNGNWNAGAWSGGGGLLCATFPCAPGDTLKFEIAQGGQGAVRNGNGGAGGWPDGGPGARGDNGSGGGGGSTRFYINSALKAVAGGGGGSGGATPSVAGGGGGTTAQSATDTGGTGGSQSAGGVDSNDTSNANKTGRSIVAFPGVQRTGGYGGNTGNTTTTTTDDGGGGGGGYYGGGGGGGDGRAGGGGSSWADSDATNVTHYRAERQTPAFAPLGYATVASGVNSASGGAAVAGGNGYAMAFFGTAYSIAGQTTSTTSDSTLANYKSVIQVTIGTSTAKWLCIRVAGAAVNNHRAVIYTDSAGSPSTLVGTAGPIASAGASSFLMFDLANLALPAGTYWIGLHSEGANSIACIPDGAGTKFATGDAYSDGTATAFGSSLPNVRTYHIALVILPEDGAPPSTGRRRQIISTF